MKNHPLLCLTFDATFKIFFKQNTSLLIALLEDFLPLPKDCAIQAVELLDTEEHASESPLGKKFILDLKLRLLRKAAERPEIVNVEMQTVGQKDLTNRLLAYAARTYSQQIERGESYHKLCPVYSLIFSIVNLPEFTTCREYYHLCNIQRQQPPHLVLSEGIQFIVVELNKFTRQMKDILDQRDAWCYLLKRSGEMGPQDCEQLQQKGKDMAKAVKRLWNLSQDELMRERLEMEEMQRRDKQAQIDYALEQGMERGRWESQRNIVLKMLQAKMDVAVIAQLTELSPQQVRKIQEQSQ